RRPTPREVEEQWAGQANANCGIVLETSGLVALDVDDAAGEILLHELSQGDLPLTLSFTTGRGFRLLYRLPPPSVIKTRQFAGAKGKVSILSRGALTVMPPSWHAGGKQYKWQPRRGPNHLDAAKAPDWIFAARATAAPALDAGSVIPEGRRNDFLFR